MSNILSNRYFLSTAAALIAGFVYYGYQSSDESTSAAEATAQSAPVVETTTVSNSDNSVPAETAEAVNSEATTTDEATATTGETAEN